MGRLHLYRNIAIIFIVLAAAILCAVFLIFYSQATIVVQSDVQTVNLNFVTEIRTSSTPAELAKDEAVGGSIVTTTTNVSLVFNTSSTKAATAGNIVGQIRLVNNYTKPQKLVKTTQLQAANGVIIRTSDDVDVPAGGTTLVNVYPKDPASFTPVADGRLVIIKLWPQLQDKIYGEVIDPLQVASGNVNYLSNDDLERAKKEIVAKAVSAALAQASSSDISISGELVSFTLDKKLGDVAKTFTMQAIVRLKIINADQAQLASLIQSKAQQVNLRGLSPNQVDLSQVQYTVMDANNLASIIIKVMYPLKAYLVTNNELLAPENFTGKTAQQIQTWAAASGAIKNIQVIISPYWRDTTPLDPNRIKVVVKQP